MDIFWIVFGTAIAFIAVYGYLAYKTYDPQRQPKFGVTFSKYYAELLGLDWREAYLAILDDLQVKYLRLPIYWDEVERADNQFDFSAIDWQLDQAAARNVKVVLNLGWRQPRWPECHHPEWFESLSADDQKKALMELLEIEVNRYKNHPAVELWQVENEPLLNVFGECPKANPDLLKAEVDYVRSLDSRPIMLTASGELALWHRESRWSDILGSTLYRVTWNRFTGYQKYWMIPPSLYRIKALIFGHDLNKFWISELQMEPWFPGGDLSVDLGEQFKSMSPQQMRRNYEYAIKTNAARHYLWGAEWWYFTKTKKGTEAVWDVVKKFPWSN